ncbi:MAG: hypothetical protein ACI9OJ_002461, partial [Myxococcota bacterium]
MWRYPRLTARFVGLGLTSLIVASCTDAPSTPDVMSELPGETRNRSYGNAANTPEITCESPDSGALVELTGVETRVSIVWRTSTPEALRNGAYRVAWFVDSDTVAGSQSTLTPIEVDLAFGEHLVTVAAVDSAGQPLTDARTRCSVNVRVTRACEADAECADDFLCNTTHCAKTGGVGQCAFGPAPNANCCQTGFQCAGSHFCDLAAQACVACSLDSHCDDGNSCTTDTCQGGACVQVTSETDCCDCSASIASDVQCDDGKFCTLGTCNCGTGVCSQRQREMPEGTSCCEVGDSVGCNDSNPSTSDSCVAGSCRNTPVSTGCVGTDCAVVVQAPSAVEPVAAVVAISNVCQTGGCSLGCDQTGTPVCSGDQLVVCEGAPHAERCGDGADNDCDGSIDEGACVSGRLVRGAAIWTPSGLVTDHGDGTYTHVRRGVGAGTSGEELIVVGGKNVRVPWVAAARTAVALRLGTSVARQLHTGQPLTVAAHLVDAQGRPAGQGQTVKFTLHDKQVGSCVADFNGLCTATATLPHTLFGSAATISIVATAGLVETTTTVALTKAADALSLKVGGVGATLPAGAVVRGNTFEMPIVVNTGSATLGAYDLMFEFVPAHYEVVSVRAGQASSAFAAPVWSVNAAGDLGAQLRINGLTTWQDRAAATGPAVEVAVVTFRHGAGVQPGPANLISGKVTRLLSDQQAQIAAGTDVVFRADVVDVTGHTWLQEVDATALFIAANDHYGASDEAARVFALRTDGSLADVTDKSTIRVADGPSDQGRVSLDAIRGDLTASATIDAYGRERTVIDLDRTTLRRVEGLDNVYQTTRLTVRSEWRGPTDALFWTDETDAVSLSVNGLVWDAASRTLAGTRDGRFEIVARDGNGSVLAKASLKVDRAAVAAVVKLAASPVCSVAVLDTGVSPAGAVVTRLAVSDQMQRADETCSLHVRGVFADGTSMDLTNVVKLSTPAGGSVTLRNSQLSAVSNGQASVEAQLLSGTRRLARVGVRVSVGLPEVVGLTVEPGHAQIARRATDAAATVKSLPTHQAFKVMLQYADGTSVDITDRAGLTVASSSTLDCASARCQATGSSQGSEFVASYGELSATARVDVVEATGLTIGTYESFSYELPRVVERSLARIEGSGHYQEASYDVVVAFSDGSSVDVSKLAELRAVRPGSQRAFSRSLSVDTDRQMLVADQPGRVDLVAEFKGLTGRIDGFVVEDSSVDVLALTAVLSNGGATLSGVKGQPTDVVGVMARLSDGTHVDSVQSIAGLVRVTSSVREAAAVSDGRLIPQANRSTVVSVTLADGVDTGETFEGATELAVDVNLTPTVGDLDLGDTSGLAFKDRGIGEEFELDGRFNVGELELGAFDVSLNYDAEVLEVVSVVAGSDATSLQLASNAQAKPGTIYINGVIHPEAAALSGSIHAFTVTYKTLKGGDGISEMGGT